MDALRWLRPLFFVSVFVRTGSFLSGPAHSHRRGHSVAQPSPVCECIGLEAATAGPESRRALRRQFVSVRRLREPCVVVRVPSRPCRGSLFS